MNKKWARNIAIWLGLSFVLFFIFLGWANCNNDPVYKTITVNETQPKVYVTRTGDHYHSGGCQYLHSSSIAMGKQEAIDSGYMRCSRCGGASSGTIKVSYKKKVEVDPTGKRVGLSIPLGLLTAIFPAILIVAKIEENEPSPVVSAPTPTPATPEVDKRTQLINSYKKYSSDQLNRLCGYEVSHVKFGIGVVTQISHDYVWVEFPSPYGEKQFKFPDAFIDEFLTLVK